MRLVDIEIANFLSFGPAQTVALADLGLVALVGRNKDSAGATSNGAGKSTIPEAIFWCLFGDTLRGLKGDEVIHSRSGRDCMVALRVEDGGHSYRIIRTRGTKGSKRASDLMVEVDGAAAEESSGGITADTQTIVDTIVGMDKRTFAQVVLLSHGARPISELTDGEQKRVLDDIMQNDVLVRAKEVTSQRVRMAQNTAAALDGELRQALAAVQGAAERCGRHEREAAEAEKIAATRRSGLRMRKSTLEGEIEGLCEGGLGVALTREEDATKAAAETNASYEELSRRMGALARAGAGPRESLVHQRGLLLGAVQLREKSSKTVSGIAGSPCPTCQRFVDPGDADAVIATWTAQANSDREAVAKIEQAIAEMDGTMREKQAALEAEQQRLRIELGEAVAAQRAARMRVAELSGALQRVSALEQQVISVEEELRRVDNDFGVYEGLARTARIEFQAAERKLAKLKQRRQLIDMELRYLLFWEHGFGNQGLKSYMLDGVLPFLNERAQRYADIMSGGDLKVWFTTQKELKKGTKVEEFQIHVVNRQGSDTYKGNSDGEKRRSNYAVSWALADLAAQRAGKPIRFKILDETFENLDDAGEEAVMRLLHDALATHETILCVTHSDRLQVQFNKTITVVKDGGHSSIETQGGTT